MPKLKKSMKLKFNTIFYFVLLRDVCPQGSRAAATPKMERLVILVNGWKPLTIIKSGPSWMLQQP